MKRYASIIALFCAPLLFSSHHMLGEETPTTTESQETTPKVQLKEPFNRMTPNELSNTGIQKLSSGEQEALVKWWNFHKNPAHQHNITKEVTISTIDAEGKHLELSDGSKITFCSSVRKKVARWVVGDTLGLGEVGKRGSITLYHMASGQKVKGKREQAPQQKAEKNKS